MLFLAAISGSKRYKFKRDRRTGRRRRLHRLVTEEMLGRPLLPGEVVHHRDGDSTNNARENLLVLPSQRLHAHLEWQLRRERSGQPPLLSGLLDELQDVLPGTLFGSILGRKKD